MAPCVSTRAAARLAFASLGCIRHDCNNTLRRTAAIHCVLTVGLLTHIDVGFSVHTKRLLNLVFRIVVLLHSGTLYAALQDGDLIFHTSRSAQSQAIQQATGSTLSHMGIILMRRGQPYVFEAVSTVRYTPLDKWIARGVDHHYVVKRLRHADSLLTPAAMKQLRGQANGFAGRPYDTMFEWSDDRLYCSELVWKLYDRALGIRIGERQKIAEFRLAAPAVHAKLRERYGALIPTDRLVISPQAMAASPLLITVETL